MSQQVIVKMINWIENNLTQKVSLDEMSKHVGYSSYYCSVKFHEMTGSTLKRYIASRRLSAAATQLKQTRLRIIDIALTYGFSSQEAFTRAFANVYGCTPSQYRKTNPYI